MPDHTNADRDTVVEATKPVQINPDRATAIDATRPYLDYLDKEMTIQGVLSAFCVALAAGVFDRVIIASPGSPFLKNLQSHGTVHLVAGCVAVIGAAVMFYTQRSDLAELCGHFALAAMRMARDFPIPRDSRTLSDCVDEADSWPLWNPYKLGLAFLVVASGEFGLALLSNHLPKCYACAGGLFLIPLLFWRLHLRGVITKREKKRLANARRA